MLPAARDFAAKSRSTIKIKSSQHGGPWGAMGKSKIKIDIFQKAF